MYYLVQMDTRLTSDFIYFRNDPENYRVKLWITGEPLQAPPGDITLVADDEKPSAVSDLVLARVDIQIHSPKLVQALQAAGVDNIEYFPVTLIDKKRGVTRTDYQVANIIGKVACLDVDHSEAPKMLNGNGYRSVKKFRLLEDQIKPLPGTTTPPQLFRLAEFSFHVIAHESLKNKLEQAGVTGIEFIRTEDVT